MAKRKQRGAGKAAVQAIFLALIASVPFAVGGIVFAKELLALMGADQWALHHGYRYTQWMLGGNAVIMFLFVINAIFRGAGDAAIAMRVLWIANGINIVLDPILIFGWGFIPAMGIEGAAVATNIGRAVGVMTQLWLLLKGGKHIRIKLSQIYWDAKIMLNPVSHFTWRDWSNDRCHDFLDFYYANFVRSWGCEAVAGSTIALRIMMFTMMPALGTVERSSNPGRTESGSRESGAG
ncbi:MAG: MATE family efflux transporter [Mangrovibacterium sp.]